MKNLRRLTVKVSFAAGMIFSGAVLAYTAEQSDNASDVAASYAYPVPFIPALGDRDITFANLAPKARIEIRTVDGELVKELEERDGDGRLLWDARGLASDVYVYRISDGVNAKTGKLLVVK